MKKFVCELCDSTDIVKQGGVFVCQSCGCKYSLEEMKKMMVEVPAEEEKEDEGAAPVYLAPEVDKHLANARRAKLKEDWEGTEKYYALVEQNDPDSIEAIFYSAFGKAMASLTEDDIYKRQATFNVLSNSLLLLIEKYHSDRIEENRAVMIRIADDICKLINSSFVYTKWKNGYGDVVKTNQVDTYRLFGEIVGHYRVAAIRIAEIDDHPAIHEASLRVY